MYVRGWVDIWNSAQLLCKSNTVLKILLTIRNNWITQSASFDGGSENPLRQPQQRQWSKHLFLLGHRYMQNQVSVSKVNTMIVQPHTGIHNVDTGQTEMNAKLNLEEVHWFQLGKAGKIWWMRWLLSWVLESKQGS